MSDYDARTQTQRKRYDSRRGFLDGLSVRETDTENCISFLLTIYNFITITDFYLLA